MPTQAVDATLKVEDATTALVNLVDPNILLEAMRALLATIDADTSVLAVDPATETTLAALLTKVNSSLAVTGTFWPASQPVTGAFYRDLALATDNVRQTQRAMSSYVAAQSSADGIVTAVTAGANRVRVLRLDGGNKPSNAVGTFATVTIKLGTTTIFAKETQVGEPIGGQVCLEGATGEDLTVAITGTGTVQLNLRYEIY